MSSNLPLSQGKPPFSTMTPPMEVPWPPMNFVSDCTTMSAPCSSGRHSAGEASVLSTTSGMPCSWAMAAMDSMSATSQRGLPTVSQ